MIVTSTATGAMRVKETAHRAPSSAAMSMPTKNTPNARAAMIARPTPAPLRRPASPDASAAPPSASAMPSACTVVGTWPSTRPTNSGTIAAVAEIGETTAIAPIASAR